MTRYAYDIECYPNLFTATFVNVEDDKDAHSFCIGVGRDARAGLAVFLRNRMTLVGYNNHSYDDPMLRFILKYKGSKLNEDLKELSDKLVSDMYRSEKEILKLRYPRNEPSPWDSIDLMKIMAFDKLGVSLKQVAINLKWHRIQDLPYEHYHHIKPEEVETVLDYNLNDVLISKKLYEEITPLRELRDELSKIYHVDLTSASDSKMANLILENIYQNELKMNISTIRDMRTHRDKILLGQCVAKFVEFKDPYLKEQFDVITSMKVTQSNGFKYSTKINYAGCIFTMGIGGLHTEDEPGVFVTDDKYIIRDMDVSSYYPNLIINNNFYPQHLGEDFIKVLKKITQDRVEAKKAKDKVKAEGLKVTVNSIFGKMGSETFWLLDAKQMISTTLSGQMGLLMLIEDLNANGIQVISANTDGIVCRIARELENKYYEVAKNWEKKTNLELEFTTYKKYVRRDVNSYITEKEDGTTKEKGAFVKKVELKKGYHMPIVAKALHAYFIQGIPVKQTLEESKDIMDFCLSQKSGGGFSIELHSTKGIEHLQKTNRYFISKKGGALLKRGGSNKLIGLQVGRLVQVLNTYDKTVPFEDYVIDLSFYEKEVMKIVDEIEPKQTTLFDIASVGNTSIKKMEMPKKLEDTDAPEEKLTVRNLNKLGKNQLLNKLWYIAENRQIVEDIDPRYVYVIGFNIATMEADVYSLAKGTYQLLTIDKKTYNKTKLWSGQLVYCTKFKKLEYGFGLIEYKITDKIEERKDRLL